MFEKTGDGAGKFYVQGSTFEVVKKPE